jgi:hypothetical protein
MSNSTYAFCPPAKSQLSGVVYGPYKKQPSGGCMKKEVVALGGTNFSVLQQRQKLRAMKLRELFTTRLLAVIRAARLVAALYFSPSLAHRSP